MSGLSKDFDITSVASTSQDSQVNRKLRVTLLSREWRSSTDGDLSTINRELAIQLAKHSNVEVSVFLLQCDEEDINNAASHHVQLVKAKKVIGCNPVDWLRNVPDGHVMDCVVGHGVSLGKQVQFIKKDHQCKWIQVVHTASEELGMYKNIWQGEELHKIEVELCEMADQIVAIGPKLTDAYKGYLRGSKKKQNVINLTPSIFPEFLKVEQAPEERRTFSVLVIGSGDSCEDFILKGFDLAAQAVVELKDKSYKLKFVGAPRGKEDEIADKLLQHGIDRNQLIVRSFSDSRKVLANLFCESDLAIMPSKTEGFGVSALEALSAGLPVLVSGNSGLGEALKEVPQGSQFVVDSEDPKEWAKKIKVVQQTKREVRLSESRLLRENYQEKYNWEKPIRCLVERMYSLTFGSSGDHSFHSLMEYGQFPFPSTSVSQDNLFQERSHSQSLGSRSFISPGDMRPASSMPGSSGDHSSHPSMEYGQFPFPSTSVSQDNLFRERSHSQRRRPVIATRDKRPAFPVLGDHNSKQFRGELRDYHHSKGSSGDNSSHPSMEYGQCPLPSTSVPPENLFQERSHSQRLGSRSFIAAGDTRPASTMPGSSGDHSFHSSMEYGQFPFPSTSVPQDNLFQERSHSQSSGSRPFIAPGDMRPASTMPALKGSSGDHSFHSLVEYGQFPFPSTSVPQDNLFQERSHSQSLGSRPFIAPGDHSSHSSMEYGQFSFPSTSVSQDNLFQERSHSQNYPEKLVALIRREYKGTVLCPFPWCEEELQFELSKIFTRLTIVCRKKERAKLTKDPVKMTEVLRPYKKCECECECKCEREKPRVVLIEGEPGIGKTTYCQKLAYDWSVGDIPTESSFPKVDILLRLTCRDMKTAKIEDAIEDQLLPRDVNEKDKENFFYFIRHYQSRILLVLDGLDELPQNLFKEFLPLIKGRVLPLTYLIITARHEVGINVRLHSDALFEIKGYTKEDADSYIKKYFSCHENSRLAGKLIRKINNDSQLRELTANALNTALLCLVFEDSGGRLPRNKTMLYCELVDCVLRRYCSKKEIRLCDKSPIDKYMHQLNQLGKLALEALLKDQLAFTPGELESQSTEFLQLGFLSREASVSKIRPKPTYAFIHKTFQEFFAAFHLSLELETAERHQRALLTQLSLVDKYWQVWKFLITMVAGKSEKTATFLVSRLWASFQRKKPRKSVKRQYTRQPLKSSDSEDDSEDDSKDDSEGHSEDDSRGDPHDEHDKSCRGELFGILIDHDTEDREDTKWETRWRARSLAETDEVSFFEKTVDAIAQCEQGNNKLSSCQIKMARALAHCFPKDEVIMQESYLPANSSLWGSQFSLVFYEYLKGNHKLKELVWGVSASAALADVLKASHTLTHLHLETGRWSKSLTQALQANLTVTHLNMSCARVNDVQAKAIGEFLRSNHTLTHLSIADNQITHIGVEALADALRSNKILKNLNIGDNNIGDEGAKALGKVLQSNHTLTRLSIARNGITHIGVEALADALRSNKILENLDIGSNNIGDEGAKVLGKVLQSNHTLTHLSIAFNQIRHIGVEALADALRSNKILKNLDIGNNNIGDEVAKVLGKVLQSNDTLTHLSIAYNQITHIGIEALADALRSNKILKNLNIGSNYIGDEGAKVLGKVLQSNHTLTHLFIADNRITHIGVEALAEALKSNKILKDLDIRCNSIGYEKAEALRKVLLSNHIMTHF